GALTVSVLFGVPSGFTDAEALVRLLQELGPSLLLPAVIGTLVCFLTRGLLAWGTWVLSVPAVLLTAGVCGYLAGGGLFGAYVYAVYFTGPLVLFVVLLRLSWLL